MSGFISGEARSQSTLFPERIDDYITEENPVRVIDVFVDSLDLTDMGFKTSPAWTGRPGYHPSTMLKLFIYGYLNRVQSSRRLERESGRNLELIWLLGRLSPDFKTIADFRKDNGRSIQRVCREFILICRKLELFSEAIVAIDGSKFKGVNNRNNNFTKAKLKGRRDQIDVSIARYLDEISRADQRDSAASKATSSRLKGKIEKLKQEVDKLNRVERLMEESTDNQVSFTDPDARSMSTSGRGTATVGYNVQSAVDAKNHLIVTHKVTNVGNDRNALHDTAAQAKEVLDVDQLEVVADRGYYNGSEIYKCEQSQITAYIPRTKTSGNKAKGLFGKADFKWIEKDNEYECPAGERLIWRFVTEENGKKINKYWSSSCPNCLMKKQCTTGVNRRVARWEHETVLENMEARLELEPDRMRVRRSTVEHPFGTIKMWMGSSHFLMKSLKHVSTEMSLHVLAYNLKRVMNIMGNQKFIAVLSS